MPSFLDILFDDICPGIGVILATLTFTAPVRTLAKSIQNASSTLGSLNPTPWAYMTGNCLGWVSYSYVIRDWFVFWANAPGLLLSLWLNFGAAKLLYAEEYHRRKGRRRQRNMEEEQEEEDDEEMNYASVPLITRHEQTTIFILAIWIFIFTFLYLIQPPPSSGDDNTLLSERTIGIAVNINLCFFYGAPLGTIWNVLQCQNSDSIHRRTMIMNTSNSFFWMVYGLARMDWFLIVPNGMGVFFGFIQVLLLILFPSGGGGGGDVVLLESDGVGGGGGDEGYRDDVGRSGDEDGGATGEEEEEVDGKVSSLIV